LDIKVEEITFGDDVIMVPADNASRIKEIEQQKTGLLTRLLTTANVTESVKETVEMVGEKIGQVLKNTKLGKEEIEDDTEQEELESKKVEMQPEKSDQ